MVYYLDNLFYLCTSFLSILVFSIWNQILRKAQDQLIGDVNRSAIGNVANSVEVSSAATALKDERLTFVWLDGEVQKVSFQLHIG